ncbi:GTPase Era [Candidatus Coxiella mudrowiae]|uniref:GTPase Era n=1 Tax=Candidatus Coxiella mudrowiae TaxID=2054173 RepID=UPI000C287533|nr:GTPase Era [Candidatus Coxiella mudrowiae]
MNKNVTYCGYAAIIGRPNVGKSSLLNQILGYKLSITSRKPQTTRYRIPGVKTFKNIQVIYVDTPGLHSDTPRMINRYMNRIARQALQDVDLILFVIEPHWDERDTWVLKQLQNIETPVFLIINKIDQIKAHSELLPLIEKVSSLYFFKEIIPLSAKTEDQIGVLEQKINDQMPESPFYFPPEQVTDRSDQFLAAEIIREKLIRSLGQEIPYSLAVTLVMFQREEKILRISATIWIERKGQKEIVIGKNGERLKKIGTTVRIDIERLFNQKVFLQLWVKVKSGWSDSERLLKELGFEE